MFVQSLTLACEVVEDKVDTFFVNKRPVNQPELPQQPPNREQQNKKKPQPVKRRKKPPPV